MPLSLPIDLLPSVAGLVPAALVGGIGSTIEQARQVLRLRDEQIHPYADGSVSAELAVPPGTWRIWPDRGIAAWLGRRQPSLPRTNDIGAVELDLLDSMRRLHARGLWCVEIRLRDTSGWSRPMDSYTGLSELVHRAAKIEAISGIFSGGESGPARVELHREGLVLAANHHDAERWLLVAHDIADDR